MKILPPLLAAALLVAPRLLLAHGDHSADEAVSVVEPVAYGLPGSTVSITERDGKRIVESNGIPNYRPGRFPNAQNPNTIRPQNIRVEMPLAPVANSFFTPLRHMRFGIAVNGVVFDPATAEFWRNDRASIWNEEAIVGGRGTLGMDNSNAHVQPDGTYHYHGIPNGLVAQLGGRGKMNLLGWAADGYPIYGPWAPRDPADPTSPVVEMRSSYRLKEGNRPGGSNGPGGRYDGTYTPDFEYVAGLGDLDEANGRTGVTPEFPGGTYYYVLTETFPYVPRNFRGTPDESFRHRPGPGGPGGPEGPGRGHRPPPPPFL